MKRVKKALSLTELMIVLVVIALLFAAIAPIITKRHIAETHENESIWNYVSGDTNRDAFFDPGNPRWTSSVYVGMAPSAANNDAGKVVIDNGWYGNLQYIMPQMQFRYSKSTQEQGKGINTATLMVDPTTILFGSVPFYHYGDYSSVFGLLNFQKIESIYFYSLLGSQAMGNALLYSNNARITAVGHKAAYRFGSAVPSSRVNGIYIGSDAGSGAAEIDTAPTENVAIGYKSMSAEGNAGSHNVFLGAHTGNGFTSTESSYNTIVGSTFSRNNASYNTIIGYGVYTSGEPSDASKVDIKAMTAIGYKACNSLYGSNDGSRVCIGANSGVSSNNTPDTYSTDDGEHIFIGGKSRAFPGRSVLEVHNNTVSGNTIGNVVINSNLVVRGNFYPSDDSGNIVYNKFTDTQTISAETPYFRCSDDAYQSILSFNNYVCKTLTSSNPKSINVLQKGGNCSVNGGYPNGGGCPNILSSDIRLKTDITENNDGLDKILQLKPYNYTYKNNPNTKQVGVIAQDLQKVFADAVSKDNKGFLSIRLEDMFYALVNSVKQLAQKVDDIVSKIADIQNDFVTIRNDHKNMEKQVSLLDKRIKKLERK